MRKNLQWILGHSSSPDIYPKEMVDANVPGNANLDWAIATDMPDWKYGINFKQYRWMEDCWWLYEAKIPSISINSNETLFFISEGIDYQYRILLDGKIIFENEGMFSQVMEPLYAGKNSLLQIWIAPVPKDPLGEKDTNREASQTCKPAVSYGWDWHPRLIPSGIWMDTYLEVRPASRFEDVSLDYILSDDFSVVEITFSAMISGHKSAVLMLTDPDGNKVLQLKAGESATLSNPKLWWCNGYGEPNLYKWDAILYNNNVQVDKMSGIVGFRKVELTMNEGAWNVPDSLPKGRSPTPITITLNGVPVFAKGSNWVNPEIFTGTITHDTYLPLIKLAKEANYNILRCWGGAIINKDSFFDLCDLHGIMVWQDFPLACNDYRGTPEYLKVLEQEARAIIKRLKHHACLVLWCGGNELFNSWSKMTDQSPALRLLNKLCYELDFDRPFIMTSPICGMGHGNYLFRYSDGREVYQVMPEASKTAYAEFGVPSISNRSCIEAAAKESDVFPMQLNDITVAHHAFTAWDGDTASWACLGIISDYFGEAKTLDDLIVWSQWLQSEGYKCIYEEARRQKPFCSMALNWCFNEPWPTIANNSIVNYPAEPKTSFSAVTDACRPLMSSARIPKFSWRGGEVFSIELWLLNDSHSPITPGKVDVSLEIDSKVYPVDTWCYNGTVANENLKGPRVELKLPELEVDGFTEMKLILSANELSSQYRLLYKS